MQYSLVKLTALIFSFTSVTSLIMKDTKSSIMQTTDGSVSSITNGGSSFTEKKELSSFANPNSPLSRRDLWEPLWGLDEKRSIIEQENAAAAAEESAAVFNVDAANHIAK